MRLACAYVPDLELQALLRAEPLLAQPALAVTDGLGPRARILGATAKARAAGVYTGQGASEARLLCPELELRPERPALVESAREALLDAAASTSPRVEELEPGLVAVDAEGLRAVWGDERAVASTLATAVRRVGLAEVNVAIASGKRLASLAARQREGLTVIPAAESRAYLHTLPLEALAPEAALLVTLHRWGLRTVGELAMLPREGVGTRLGAPGLALHRMATGEDTEPLKPIPTPERYQEAAELDYTIELLEPLLFLLRPALERLGERLACRGMIVGALVLRLKLDPYGETVLPVSLAGPTAEVDNLLALCRRTLEAHPPTAPIRGVVLDAEPAVGKPQQLGLWDLPVASPSEVLGVVSQLAALVGADSVGALEVPDHHLAEKRGRLRFEPPRTVSLLEKRPQPGATLIGLRRLRPPLPAEVTAGPRGQPLAFRAGSYGGRIVACAGPWRFEVEWFGAPTQRDVFDAELERGGVVLLARDLRTGAWSLLGVYD